MSGDPITAIGHVVANGTRHGIESAWERYLLLDDITGTASIGPLPSGELPDGLHALPGRERLVADGEIALDPAFDASRNPLC